MFNTDVIIHEPLYPHVNPLEIEKRLFNTTFLRRLKFLAHFGAGSLVSPVVHSRYEHTVGVWKLVCFFFPNDKLMRLAAILHDIGHLPFSHSVEKSLGFDHHVLTNRYIESNEISTILQEEGVESKDIIQLLNRETVLTGRNGVLGIDHIDSFFRDTYMYGTIDKLPKDIIWKLTCTSQGIETDSETAELIMKLIVSDHKVFLSPLLLAVDRMLAVAIKLYKEDCQKISGFALMKDYEVINLLKKSNSERANKIVDLLLNTPSKIVITDKIRNLGIEFGIRKVYAKSPLVNGVLFTETSRAQKYLRELESLIKNYEVLIDF
ncbi:HD superfamily phosphohydrolase [Virgibacillus halotolerans]|uniref:HD domain-containing protein n=1 Tax=Virgibacillus halotolerans TaxID=1071053 RepID=UPI001EF79873|nr:HD domain-containing protein [Virgibacillus halotolerans]MBM7601485.1 HD superfamily phosphohydrolase [Virgibacillus halotolerans]